MKKKHILAALLVVTLNFVAFSSGSDNNKYDLSVTTYAENITKANDGDGDAMLAIAKCFETGTGVKRDLKEAWEWYGKSALEGNIEAQYIIGTLYRDGIGTKKDYKESAYWFRKAARNGHKESLLNIARQF